MNNHTLTQEQYEELFKEVMLFAKIGGIVEEDVIWDMCLEETKELKEGFDKNNLTLIIDSVCDTFVTYAQLHNAYFDKLKAYSAPFLTLNTEDVSEWSVLKILEDRDKDFPNICMESWYSWAVDVSEDYKFNLYKVIKEVNRSNFTKYPSLEDVYTEYDSLEQAAAYCEVLGKTKGKNYPNVVASVNTVDGVDYVVFRQDHGKGKVVKPFFTYQEPNFEGCC